MAQYSTIGWGSNLDTSKPNLRTSSLGYKPKNNSPFYNPNKPLLQNGMKGSLTNNMNLEDKESSDTFSKNYLGMATAALGGITNTIGNVNNATGKDNKTNAGIEGGVNTVMNVVDTAFPIVGAIEGLAGTAGTISKATNPLTTYIGKDGKQYSYQTGKNGDVAAAWTAVGNPRGNFSNSIESFSGTKENYGMNNIAMGIADLFTPFLSEGVRNKKAREFAQKDSKNAYTKEQTDTNFSNGLSYLNFNYR